MNLPIALLAAVLTQNLDVKENLPGNKAVGADKVSEISWLDWDGKTRSVQFVTESEKYHPGWLSQYRYDDPEVVCNAVDSGSGGLNDVSHNGGILKNKGNSEWGTRNVKFRWLFRGEHHGIIRVEYDMGFLLDEKTKTRGKEPIHVTRDLFFRDGDSTVLYAITLDFSDVPKDKANVDTRSPYMRWDWDGSEAGKEGFGMGPYTGFMAGTSGTLVCLDIQNPKGKVVKTIDDNLVPYAYQWNDKSGRMEAIVATQTYAELPQGSEYWAGDTAAPIIKAGEYERDKVNGWELPYQLGGYSGWIEKMSWQVPYQLGHEEVVVGPRKYKAWPKYSYATLVLLDKKGPSAIAPRFASLLREQEQMAGFKASAKVGKVNTEANPGPGRASESEPLKTPGYDPLLRAWVFTCEESKADVTVDLGKEKLRNPTLIFDHYHGAKAPVIKDAHASLDGEAMRLYVTLKKEVKGKLKVRF